MTDAKRFLLRLRPSVFQAVRQWADDDMRSMNAQIEYLLTESLRGAGREPHDRECGLAGTRSVSEDRLPS
ncbi:MAG: Arc family DNA-binding protein [Solirubrobacteraceae bacterium]